MIEEPNLNCPKCFELKKQAGFTPYCMRPSGCAIEDLATDVQLNIDISEYLAARSVFEMAEINEHLKRVLIELDLNDPRTILELESIYARFKQKRAQEESRKRAQTRR